MIGKEKALLLIRGWTHIYRRAMSEGDRTTANEYCARVYAAVEVLADTEILSKEESYELLDKLTGVRKRVTEDA